MNPVEVCDGCLSYMQFLIDINGSINIEDELDAEEFCIRMRDWLYDNS